MVKNILLIFLFCCLKLLQYLTIIMPYHAGYHKSGHLPLLLLA